MPDWATDLPCYPIEGTFSETPQDNAVRFRPEVGPPIGRRRSTAVDDVVAITWKFSRAERETFLTFFRTELKNAQLPFNMRHPITSDLNSWVFDSTPELASVSRHAHTVAAQLRRIG